MQKAAGNPQVSVTRTMTITGLLVLDDPNVTSPTWRSDAAGGSASGNVSIDETTTAGTDVKSLKARGGAGKVSGAPDFGAIQLSIDPDSGTYTFGGGIGVMAKELHTVAGKLSYTADTPDTVDGGDTDLKLPSAGLELSGTRRFGFRNQPLVAPGEEESARKADRQGVTFGDSNKLSKQMATVGPAPIYGEVTWKFTPGAQEQIEAIIVPETGFDQWLPLGSNDATKPGNVVHLTARLRKKYKPTETVTLQATWEWKLVDTSRELGSSLNDPPKGKGKDDFDFRIESPGKTLTIKNKGQDATSVKPSNESAADLWSMDFGGYTKVQVSAIVGGQRIVAELDRQPGVTTLMVPKDENKNHVADAWEKDMRHAATDDDDPINDQKRAGDGFTYYEEYRGFQTLARGTTKRHTRLDPNAKDAFVFDPDGLARKYFTDDTGYNVAGLSVRYIDKDMVHMVKDPHSPEHRWVNYNSSADKSYAKQYAVHVISVPDFARGVAEPSIIGQAICKENERNFNAGAAACLGAPMKKFYVLQVAPSRLTAKFAEITDPAVRTYLADQMMRITVNHEIGHAFGIHHHNRPQYGGEYGGVRSCLTRYEDAADYKESPTRLAWKRTYCRKSETFADEFKSETADGVTRIVPDPKLNKDGSPVFNPRAAKIPSDNCWGQIDVKSDP